MAVYAIGDVQGCFDELMALLRAIDLAPARDRLWFTGDLVNRGPKSLEVLRYVRSLGESAVTVLGNHDLHLLAVARSTTPPRRKDTFADVLAAPDCAALLAWLPRQPLLHHDGDLDFTLVHAGLAPDWDSAAARACAAEVEQVLSGDRAGEVFAHMFGDQPLQWRADLRGWPRLRFITNCLTRLRYCYHDGRLAVDYKGAPGGQPQGSCRGSICRSAAVRLPASFSATGRRSAPAQATTYMASTPAACGAAVLPRSASTMRAGSASPAPQVVHRVKTDPHSSGKKKRPLPGAVKGTCNWLVAGDRGAVGRGRQPRQGLLRE